MAKRILQIIPAIDWFAVSPDKDGDNDLNYLNCYPIAAFALVDEDGDTFIDAVADSDLDLYSNMYSNRYFFVHASQIVKISVYKCRHKKDGEQ